jgi:hypothetical protein
LISGAWFIAVFAMMMWVWGLNPKALATPDEALNRFAAALIKEHGRPFLALPFPDPEDLAHPRHWVSVGDHAIPSYAPVAIYWYALLLRLNKVGLCLVAALPASAAAAFTWGTAKLLPPGRQWLALPAPILGFPGLYWLMRPWINLSLLLICLCWAFFFWASWRRSGSSRHLAIAIAGVGAAAAVRPDYAAYLLVLALLLGAAASPTQWKRVLVLVFCAGASAVALNLLLNWLVTGHPSLAAYQIVAARDEGASSQGGILGLVRQLLVPMGIPMPSTALTFLSKYWLQMASVAGLSFGLLALVPILLEQPRLARALYALALAIMLCFMLSHMDPTLAGASERVAWVHHSMPRYWSPLYLLAALPPILFLGYCKNRAVLIVGAVALCALAVSGGYHLYKQERWALANLHTYQRQCPRLLLVVKQRVPSNAMVYSATYDKILWPYWRLGTIGELEPTATSIHRATEAKINVFVYEPGLTRAQYLDLNRALNSRHLMLVKIHRHGLFRVAKEQDRP